MSLANLLVILLATAATLLLVPTSVLFTEIISAVTRSRGAAKAPGGERRQIAVVIPAQNESALIAATIRSIVPQMAKSDRLIVVADNCSDATAAVAVSEGAEVIVRSDLTRRGKGYALDRGVRHLESNPPDIVMIIDADCRVSRGSIDSLARLCSKTSRPIQAINLMHAGEDAGRNMKIAEFAWIVKNQVRPLGLHRLGLPCQLMGTGMAFPWVRIQAATLATGHIVEDLKLGLELARAGAPPLLCPEALVSSNFPSSRDAIRGQRTRWEHGHVSVLLSDAPQMLLESLRRRDANLAAMALDLSVPPLALLMLLVCALWTATVALLVSTGSTAPFCIMTVIAVLLAGSVLMSWISYGRRVISFGGLVLGFMYPLRKIPLYIRFLVSRQLEWVRSKRDSDQD